jgi:hypothetical protein
VVVLFLLVLANGLGFALGGSEVRKIILVGSGLVLAIMAISATSSFIDESAEVLKAQFSVPYQGIRLAPNYGVRQSAKHAILFGTTFGVISIFAWTRFPHAYWLILTFSGFAFFGGIACIQHLGLRIATFSCSHTPWNYASFLDYCAERIFLRKVGGGYIFIHRMFMEHFAAMSEEDIQRLAGESQRR